jgi:hypothetical protein
VGRGRRVHPVNSVPEPTGVESGAGSAGRLVYEPNPKHKHPYQPGRKGSLCDLDITPEEAHAMLDRSVPEPDGKRRFATRNGRAYAGREHRPGRWHGYPVDWREVPPEVIRSFLDSGQIRRRDMRR